MKKVTSKDVAMTSGVSQSLVSLIINNVPDVKIKAETRQHVLEIAKKMNYRVNMNARGMKSNKATAIGLLSSWDTNSFVFSPVIKGVQSVCEENDFSVVMCTGKKSVDGVADFITYYQQNRIDGLIYISYVGVNSDGVINSLQQHNIPFVCVIGARDIVGVSCVDVSFLKSGYLATLHLIERRYDKIGYFHSNNLELLNYAELERLQGCREAAKDKDTTLLDIHLHNEFHDMNEEDMVKVVANYLKLNQTNAIIGTSYICYIILKAAARLGINVIGRAHV